MLAVDRFQLLEHVKALEGPKGNIQVTHNALYVTQFGQVFVRQSRYISVLRNKQK